MKLRWTHAARRDLRDLRAWMEADSPGHAAEVAASIASVERLSRLPGIGRPGRLASTREVVLPDLPLVIPYRARGGAIELLRVLHTARRWPPQRRR